MLPLLKVRLLWCILCNVRTFFHLGVNGCGFASVLQQLQQQQPKQQQAAAKVEVEERFTWVQPHQQQLLLLQNGQKECLHSHHSQPKGRQHGRLLGLQHIGWSSGVMGWLLSCLMSEYHSSFRADGERHKGQ